ncbi:hypothetical protein HDU93_005649 [Gonapodya sp. JEL0774]|nr:hypothetical protein HDU93_005649 [Gonapodya sp. JEL0774]
MSFKAETTDGEVLPDSAFAQGSRVSPSPPPTDEGVEGSIEYNAEMGVRDDGDGEVDGRDGVSTGAGDGGPVGLEPDEDANGAAEGEGMEVDEPLGNEHQDGVPAPAEGGIQAEGATPILVAPKMQSGKVASSTGRTNGHHSSVKGGHKPKVPVIYKPRPWLVETVGTETGECTVCGTHIPRLVDWYLNRHENTLKHNQAGRDKVPGVVGAEHGGAVCGVWGPCCEEGEGLPPRPPRRPGYAYVPFSADSDLVALIKAEPSIPEIQETRLRPKRPAVGALVDPQYDGPPSPSGSHDSNHSPPPSASRKRRRKPLFSASPARPNPFIPAPLAGPPPPHSLTRPFFERHLDLSADAEELAYARTPERFWEIYRDSENWLSDVGLQSVGDFERTRKSAVEGNDAASTGGIESLKVRVVGVQTPTSISTPSQSHTPLGRDRDHDSAESVWAFGSFGSSQAHQTETPPSKDNTEPLSGNDASHILPDDGSYDVTKPDPPQRPAGVPYLDVDDVMDAMDRSDALERSLKGAVALTDTELRGAVGAPMDRSVPAEPPLLETLDASSCITEYPLSSLKPNSGHSSGALLPNGGGSERVWRRSNAVLSTFRMAGGRHTPEMDEEGKVTDAGFVKRMLKLFGKYTLEGLSGEPQMKGQFDVEAEWYEEIGTYVREKVGLGEGKSKFKITISANSTKTATGDGGTKVNGAVGASTAPTAANSTRSAAMSAAAAEVSKRRKRDDTGRWVPGGLGPMGGPGGGGGGARVYQSGAPMLLHMHLYPSTVPSYPKRSNSLLISPTTTIGELLSRPAMIRLKKMAVEQGGIHEDGSASTAEVYLTDRDGVEWDLGVRMGDVDGTTPEGKGGSKDEDSQRRAGKVVWVRIRFVDDGDIW